MRSFVGGAVNSAYDYLNLATRSPQVCINKGERVNKLEVSECSKSFNTFLGASQNKLPLRKGSQHCPCVFFTFLCLSCPLFSSSAKVAGRGARQDERGRSPQVRNFCCLYTRT